MIKKILVLTPKSSKLIASICMGKSLRIRSAKGQSCFFLLKNQERCHLLII